MATLVALLLRCGVVANADALAAIVAVESGGNPLALGVNGGFELVRQPRDPGEAVAMARWLADHGHSFDAGLAQVNSANLTRLGLDAARVFDVCTNLRAADQILEECHERASQRWLDPQRRLAAALSCYNTGDLTRGISNGYVHAVLVAGAPFLTRNLHRVRADGATARREEALHQGITVAGPGRRPSAVLAGEDAFAAPMGEAFSAGPGAEHTP